MLSSCSSNPDQESETGKIEEQSNDEYKVTEQQFQSSEMKLGKMMMKEFNKVVKAKGMIDVPPEYRSSVSSYFGGTVKSIRLLTGEQVKKGQTLFTLENPEYVQMQQDYLEAREQLNYLQADYERQKNLAQDNVTSQKKYLKAESDYMVTKVKMESVAKKLKLMNIDPNQLTIENMKSTIHIKSPISGYVTSIDISQGAFLNPSQSAISIINTEHLHLELNIFEKDLGKIKVGQAIRFTIQDDNDSTYNASVHLINKNIDSEKRTVGIHGHLSDPNASNRFNPGMYVEADILSESKSKWALPEDALVDIEGRLFALILAQQVGGSYEFERKEIKVGASNGNVVEILNHEEFNEDTAFLINGAFNLIKE